MTFQKRLAWQTLELQERSSVACQVARYALGLDYAMLPEKIVHQAKRCVLDALGCAIGAFDAPGFPICEAMARETGGTGEATVFGTGLRTNALNASLVNGFLVRFLDYNDMGLGNHPSDALASIMAVCEREQASGRDLILALVIAYELAGRFNDAIDFTVLAQKGWTGEVKAGFNMAPSLGRVMGLDEMQIANAIGICMSHTLPMKILDSDRDENVMAKNLRFGWAAHDALLSCMLAKRGFTGPVRIFESQEGINNLIAGGTMDLERLVDFSGWRMPAVMFKALPLNGTTHGHVLATMEVVASNDLRPEDIAHVRIRTSMRESRHTTTFAKKYPRNAESADHSAHYANAIAILDRSFSVDAFRPERFSDPMVLELIEKITVEGDPELGFFAGISEITTRDGRLFSARVDLPKGIGEPLGDGQLEDKFRDLAGRHMEPGLVDRIVETVWNLENLRDVGELASLMIVPELAGRFQATPLTRV